ncbi:MAG: response regulator [Deltaproteobacteria bacterium]|nr:response regulator [Deltaproteobacteria bacterium]
MNAKKNEQNPLGEILIAEDNPSDLKFLSKVLEKAGYKIRPATDGHLALRSIEAKLPDLVLLDISLPDLSGVEICRRLKAELETKDLPVIFTSAHGESAKKVEALEAGGIDYITKPMDSAEVLARVKTHLHMYHLQQKLRSEIKERKQAEEALFASEKRTKDTFNAINDAVFLHPLLEDGFGPFVEVNDTACERYGYTREEFSTLAAPDITIKTDAKARGTQTQRKKLRDTRQIFEAMHVRKSGKIIPVEISSTVIELEGKPIILSVARDITERKHAEIARAKLEEQLHQAQKMESIGRLAGGVAHDFNNILCAITGNASLALDDLSSEDPLHESIVEIASAAARASRLTRQLLAFSRKQVIAPRVINLSDLIENLHPMLRRLLGEDTILKTSPKKDLGHVLADPSQIEQVVLNLAINARDAMPDGGELLIETADIVLDDAYCAMHATTKPGAYVMLAVSDTGAGMSAEIREKVFEPFFTTKQLGQGTGLGLATVHGIVEQSGGRIEVYSEEGRGTSFKIFFPRASEEAKPLVKTTVDEAAGGQETVLVVEDEEMVCRLAVKLLSRRGYQVLSATSPGEAIALVEQHEGPIDLLLTDVIMPKMNGRELADKITELRPEIKVLFTSGYTQNIIAHHGVLDEEVEFLAKPYSLDALATRVRQVLDGSKS